VDFETGYDQPRPIVPPALEELGITPEAWLATPKQSQAVLLTYMMMIDTMQQKVTLMERQRDTKTWNQTFLNYRIARGGRPRKHPDAPYPQKPRGRR
jgi:hypothetical protein